MNESRQTVETDTLWLSNIRALNFRKPGHLRKYCNNENFPIYGISDVEVSFLNLYQHIINVSCCSCSTEIRFIVVLVLVLEIKVIYLLILYLVSDETCIRIYLAT